MTLGGVCYIHLTTGAEYSIVYRKCKKNAREKQCAGSGGTAFFVLYNMDKEPHSGQKILIKLEISRESNTFFFNYR